MYVQFAELPVTDQDRAKRFYMQHFGCTQAADAPMGADGWRWIELKFDGADTTLHFVRRKDETPSQEPVMVLVDRDVAATTARLKGAGVEIITEPQEAPWEPGRITAEFRDSEGNRMVLAGVR
jgi:predicted enzyme related to lactoylglutathione lyase